METIMNSRITRSLLFALLLITFVGCGQNRGKPKFADSDGQPPEDKKPPRVRAIIVEKQDLTRTIELPGHVEGYQSAELKAKVGGYLKAIHVDIGDRIVEGKVLAELNIPEMEKVIKTKEAYVARASAEILQAKAKISEITAEIESAKALLAEAKSVKEEKQAQVRFATTLRDRMRTLVQGGGARREKLDEAQLQLDQAQSAMTSVDAHIRSAEAKVKVAEAKMAKARADVKVAEANQTVAQGDLEEQKKLAEYAFIRAPFNGVVTRRWLHPGAFVQPAERNSAAKPLLSVTQTDKLRIFVSIAMAETKYLNESATAQLTVPSGPGEKYTAYVIRYSPELQKSTRTMLVELSLERPTKTKAQPVLMLPDLKVQKVDEKKKPKFYPGSYVQAKLNLVHYPDTVVIPASAIKMEGGEKVVYLIEKNRIKKKAVETLYEDGEKVGIRKGLEGGETIVETGLGQLAENQEVRAEVTNQKPK